jgi:hypothetical protein
MYIAPGTLKGDVEEMMKKLLLLLGFAALLLGALTAAALADTSEFRLVVSRNDGYVGGQFWADLEIKSSANRTINSLTADVQYSSELAAPAGDPDSDWFAGYADYEHSVSKLTLPGGYFRVLVTGNAIGKTSAGVPAGFTVTTSWQRVVTLHWDIVTLSNSYSLTLLNVTDAAAYFDNAANNPLADLTEWENATTVSANVMLAVKAFLQGPYDVSAHAMKTDLRSNDLIPATSVYSYDPHTAASVPATAVDWVMVQLRSSVTGPPIFSKSLFLRSDGKVVGDDGSTETISIASLEGLKNYYVVLKQRNHLAVMSASAIALNEATATLHDFTTGQAKAYGTAPMKAMSDGAYALKAGDGNGDGGIDAIDLNSAWRPNNGTTWTYAKLADYNLDGGIDAIDANGFWRPNNGSATQVP